MLQIVLYCDDGGGYNPSLVPYYLQCSSLNQKSNIQWSCVQVAPFDWLSLYRTCRIRRYQSDLLGYGIDKLGLLNKGQFGKLALQIGIALQLNSSLIGSLSRRSPFAIPGIHLVDHFFHSIYDNTNGCKSLSIQKGIVSCIDKDLGRSCIGTGRGKDQGSPTIAGCGYW